MKNKLVLLTLFSLLSVCILTSCSDTTQIRERAIIEAMAIDYKNSEYVVTLKERPPKEDAPATYIQSSGETLFDALKNAESNDGKQIFYGHSGVFLIGQSAADRGLEQILQFMNSNYQISLNSSVLLTKSSAEKLLKSEDFSSSDSDFSIGRIQDCGKSVDTTVIDALKMSYNLGGHLYLPLILLDTEDNVKIENCAVFKENSPEFIMTPEQTMGLNLILGNVKDGVFVTEKNGKRVSVNIVSQKTDMTFKTTEGKPHLSLKVSARGNISELGVIGGEEERKEQLKNVVKDVEKQINDAVLSTFKKTLNEEKCDIFNLKQMMKNKGYELSQTDMDNVLENLEFDVKVSFTIRHSGIQVK